MSDDKLIITRDQTRNLTSSLFSKRCLEQHLLLYNPIEMQEEVYQWVYQC